MKTVVIKQKYPPKTPLVCVWLLRFESEKSTLAASLGEGRVVTSTVSFLGLWLGKWDPTVARRFSSWMASRGKAGSCLW